MKPVLYYTINAPYRRVSQFKSDTIIAVTSEGPRGRLNGRYLDGSATHKRAADTIGRFPTRELAEKRMESVVAVLNKLREDLSPLRQEIKRLERRADADIETILMEPASDGQ